EMIVLPGHRPESAHLPEQPLHHVVALVRLGRQELAGLLAEIEQNGASLEHRDRRAAARGLMIEDRRDAVVGRHLEKMRLELFSLPDIDRKNLVWRAGLFEKNRDLVAVWRGPI